jgi:membrane AbrB-like protein
MTLASVARAARHAAAPERGVHAARRPSCAAAATPLQPLQPKRARAAAPAVAAGARCTPAAPARLRCARRRCAAAHAARASSASSDPASLPPSPPPPPPPASPLPLPLPARVALALLVGASGAAAAASLRLPLPWMLGSLVATACASLAGAPLALPPALRLAWQTVIGVMLGAAFDPSLWARLLTCASTLTGLFLATAAATALGALALRRFARYDAPTAFFAAVPGGLNDMTLIGAELGGDERVIALSHTVRLIAVVSLLPFCLRTALAGGATAAPVRACSAVCGR